MDDTVRQLLDRELIKETKARYFRYLDTKQWSNWRTCFTDDCRFEMSIDTSDPDEWVRYGSEVLERAHTVHHGHMSEITFMGPDDARAIWAMYDHVEFPAVADGGDSFEGLGYIEGGGSSRGFQGFGHYEEAYRRCGEVWKISFMRLTRLRVDSLDGARHSTDIPTHRRPSLDWLP